MSCGIYKITNLNTNKFYIGSSENIEERWLTHLYLLGRGTHHSKKLQNSFNKHGKTTFKFKILEECSIDNLRSLEQEYINNLKPYNSKIGYNIQSKVIFSYTKREITKKYRIIHLLNYLGNTQKIFTSLDQAANYFTITKEAIRVKINKNLPIKNNKLYLVTEDHLSIFFDKVEDKIIKEQNQDSLYIMNLMKEVKVL